VDAATPWPQTAPRLATTTLGIATLTFANSTDNIGVLAPLLGTLGVAGSTIAMILFAVMVGG
jgi:cadmium resistance protein CadD (predicted permease)